MWSFKDEPLKYSCYLSPRSVNNLGLSQEQFVFIRVVRYSALLKAVGRNVNYHKQAAEVTDGI